MEVFAFEVRVFAFVKGFMSAMLMMDAFGQDSAQGGCGELEMREGTYEMYWKRDWVYVDMKFGLLCCIMPDRGESQVT